MESQQSSPSAETSSPSKTSRVKQRGFASMSEEKRRLIAGMGGRTAHKMGRAHVFTAEEAQCAGRKGGRTVSQDADYMARIGSIGGATRWKRVREGGDPAGEATETQEAAGAQEGQESQEEPKT